jgi:hypothetical protein
MKLVLKALLISTLITSLAGCGGSAGGGGTASPTRADLLLGTSGTSGTVANVDITFPVFSNYSITGITTTSPSGLPVWDRVSDPNPKARVQVSLPNRVAIGSTYATVQFAIKDGSRPADSDFSNGSTAVFKNFSGTVVSPIPKFTITNVR